MEYLRQRRSIAEGLRRRPGVGLAVVQLVGAAAAAAWALWPPTMVSPQGVDGVLFALLAVLAIGSLVRSRGPGWLLQAGAGASAVLLLIAVATRATPQGQVIFGMLVLLLAVDLATFVHERALLAHLTAYSLGFALAQLANPVELGWLYLAVLVAGMASVSLLVERVVSEQRRLAEQLQHEALRDPLTGAFNRRGADEATSVLRSLADRGQGPITVAVIDLDGFKQVNDRYGHAAGDNLLRELVAAWQTGLRGSDMLARTGGDEFALALPGITPEQAQRVLQRLRELHPAPWSAGVSPWRSGESFGQAVRRADHELYLAKTARAAERPVRPAPAATRPSSANPAARRSTTGTLRPPADDGARP